MNAREVGGVLEFINSAWPQKPIGENTARIWGAELSQFGASEAMGALRRLVRICDWRPSLKQIIEAIEGPPPKEHDSVAFESVIRALALYPPGARADKVTPAAREAIRRMGGWSAAGRWDMSQRNWREKEFARVFADVQESEAAGRPPALAAAAGAPMLPRAPTPHAKAPAGEAGGEAKRVSAGALAALVSRLGGGVT